ncbi:AAA family ATPase [Flectobacillus sp. DC10W]|uniref:AAA family ATPase n=1 Tax=Flectobacillus longus TaxID=2984207 RepID=A0ABT6YRK0_9BACT|nr:AAA family ATPase [Flectobacillus longus]MDI9866222.1 AAA family ATPase [Flectobacillus longus]
MPQKVLILQGIPASGKSTFAKSLVADSRGLWKRLNKDDMRAMLDDSVHSKENESFIEQLRDMMLFEALKAGKNVVIDDTNLWGRPIERVKKVVEQFQKTHRTKIEIEIKPFEVDLGTCIERDSQRESSVGATVVSKLYRQHIIHKEQLYNYAEKDESLPPALICELDNVIAIPTQRSLQDTFLCENDLGHQPIKELLDIYRAKGYKIILLTQRPETYRRQTQNWLYYNRVEFDELLMFPVGIKGIRHKKEIYEQEIASKYQVKLTLETQQEAVDLWRLELQIPCLQVGYGDLY